MLQEIENFFNKILSVFSTFAFTDLLDILFVAAVIYVCIRIMRETRAMQLLKGIIIIAVVYAIVNALSMEASSFILQSVFSNILIIIVVLFTPEFRKILEQLGKTASKHSLKSIIHSGIAVEIAEIDSCIDAVCKAAADMSDKKIGALIVFENETMLGNIINTGTVVDAVASREMVENIFFPKSPLHDGAMIIRGYKIFAAGCILPLTGKNISSELGTRHRAALGLSEESDAVIVIVSEETGAISVAQNGTLTQGISDGDLREILTRNFVPSGSTSDDKIITKIVRGIKK